MTHPTWQLDLNNETQSALIFTPCPGTKGLDLLASLQQLKAQGVEAVVTAISHEEMQEKSVTTLGDDIQALGMQWHHLVIEDDQAPDANFAELWQKTSPQLHAVLEQGGKVAMHCMGGSGRTGLLAAHLLLECDWETSRIIEEVKALRPGAFTKPVQVEYLNKIAQK
ncbi:phosphatase [Vibrio sp. 10N.286.49.B3]|uniref:cyclin-dependent kinase inhibitor 3 family protein n=1 Tax=Vibrio sp. 10N.286.49.B3 TaxID=1880855 RepID=UPI000C864661|nr:cyclin-dependent kinase inhibitor 3 family protein [Vibrio sp. 10N.286.49.B3]PMH45444.1 phosphatase [Vibrio sp. 10N.286.49.B3]